MTALNTQAQIIELTDDQLELVEGGAHASEAPAKLIGLGFRIAWHFLTNPAQR